jgi:hypothetical protein
MTRSGSCALLQGFIVSGAGSKRFNGTYRPDLKAVQSPGFSHAYRQEDGGKGTIECEVLEGLWYITLEYSKQVYICKSNSTTPPLTAWLPDPVDGVAPPPTLAPTVAQAGVQLEANDFHTAIAGAMDDLFMAD